MSEKKSRIERYAKLRRDLIDEQQHTIETKELSKYANQLNRLDKDHFQRMDVDEETDYQSPLYRRNRRFTEPMSTEEETDVPRFEKEVIAAEIPVPNGEFPADETAIEILESYEPDEISDDFQSSYVDEVLKEVKRYNVEKGYRKKQDTQSNVLSSVLPTDEYLTVEAIERQLRKDQTLPRRSPVVEPPEEPVEEKPVEVEALDETIKLQVEHLAMFEQFDELSEHDDQQPTEIFELKETTQQIKTLLDQQDQVVKNLDQRVDSSNRYINALLAAVVILLILVIAAIIYVVLQLQ